MQLLMLQALQLRGCIPLSMQLLLLNVIVDAHIFLDELNKRTIVISSYWEEE